MVGRLDVFRVRVELLFAHNAALADLAHDGALVAYGLNDITSTGLALCTNEGSTLRDAAEGLAEIPGTADEGDLECMLVYVVLFVCRSQNL